MIEASGKCNGGKHPKRVSIPEEKLLNFIEMT